MTARQCPHIWNDAYVCEACGQIKYASAPMWAAVVKLPSGPRGVWLSIWSAADRDTVAPDPIYMGNDLIAERAGGVTVRSVQRSLEWLATHGWIRVWFRKGQHGRRGRRYIDLAWENPREDWAAEAKAALARGDDRVAGGVDIVGVTNPSQEATNPSPVATISSGGDDKSVALTLGNLGITLGSPWDSERNSSPPRTGADAAAVEAAKRPIAQALETHTERVASASKQAPDPPRKARRRRDRMRDYQPTAEETEILELHQSLRKTAQAHHGMDQTDLPKTGKQSDDLRDRLRAALAKHGPDVCRRVIVWQGRRWLDDIVQLRRYSEDSVWSPGSLDYALDKLSRAKAGQYDSVGRNAELAASLARRSAGIGPKFGMTGSEAIAQGKNNGAGS